MLPNPALAASFLCLLPILAPSALFPSPMGFAGGCIPFLLGIPAAWFELTPWKVAAAAPPKANVSLGAAEREERGNSCSAAWVQSQY